MSEYIHKVRNPNLVRCNTCKYWRHRAERSRWPIGTGVCLLHSVWVHDWRRDTPPTKRSGVGRRKFVPVRTRYTDVCEGHEFGDAKKEEKDMVLDLIADASGVG